MSIILMNMDISRTTQDLVNQISIPIAAHIIYRLENLNFDSNFKLFNLDNNQSIKVVKNTLRFSIAIFLTFITTDFFKGQYEIVILQGIYVVASIEIFFNLLSKIRKKDTGRKPFLSFGSTLILVNIFILLIAGLYIFFYSDFYSDIVELFFLISFFAAFCLIIIWIEKLDPT